MNETPRPLDGIRVLDLTRVLAGPWATMTLADLGAEVWKIEHPENGDDTRGWTPPAVDEISTYYLSVNRNKRSIAVDMNTTEGAAIVRLLAGKADVIVENFRESSLRKLGLDVATLRAANPGLIHCSISGYGRDNVYAERPGYDFVIQAEAGFMAITGEPDGDPMRLGVAFVDIATGMNAVQAILAALLVRTRTGLGQSIDIALWDSGLQMLANIGSGWLNTGRDPGRFGNQHASIVPYQMFECRDARVVVTAGNDQQYRRFVVDVLRAPELWEEPRYRTNAGRTTHRGELIPILTEHVRTFPADDLLARMNACGVPGGRVRTVGEAFESDEAMARNVIETVAHPVLGSVRMVRSPLRLSDTPPHAPTAPPGLGDDTAAVLSGVLDLDAATLADLLARGVVAGPTIPEQPERPPAIGAGDA